MLYTTVNSSAASQVQEPSFIEVCTISDEEQNKTRRKRTIYLSIINSDLGQVT